MMQHIDRFFSIIVLSVLVLFHLIIPVGASSMWSQTYGGSDGDSAGAMVQTSDEGYALAGKTMSFGAGVSDAWLIKTDEAGVIPEFPSLTILLLLLVATLVIIICKKRLPKTPNQQSY
jgi:hypothetical protein